MHVRQATWKPITCLQKFAIPPPPILVVSAFWNYEKAATNAYFQSGLL